MEIGSIFDLDICKLFNNDIVINENRKFEKRKKNYKYFNTGRSAILYLMKLLKSKHEKKFNVLLPTFICSSILDVIKLSEVEYKFYNINDDLNINLSSLEKAVDDETKYIFVIHYFGKEQNENICEKLNNLKKNKNIGIIEDLTQSLFSLKDGQIGIGDYIVASIRKWIDIPDGGILISDLNIEDSQIKIEDGYNEYSFKYLLAQLMKKEYLINNKLDKNCYLKNISEANNSLFTDLKIRRITDISKKIIDNTDFELIINIRRDNYKYFVTHLKNKYLKVKINMKEWNVPFGIVIESEFRDKLLKYLLENNIYCNIHWKIDEDIINISKETGILSNKLLTIPCDQRYGINEMNYILNVLDEFNVE